MKPLSDGHLQVVLVELHRAIEASTAAAIAQLGRGATLETTYPPNGELQPSEVAALRSLSLDSTAQNALAKLISDASAAAVFHVFCLMDGVCDPEGVDEEPWLGVRLAEPDGDDHTMLHDAFFESYWEFKRPPAE